ncbi:MAG: alkaline phosphatase family protein [Anaerolineae bacterium]|nr:alkaline phosphatase family protein [Thermoflexales bacterium]MDW8407123.1 alkaline phosphatase family protein [Anaerolineae bacterium]
MASSGAHGPTNILVIGLDGANPALMQRLAEDGVMPFWRALLQRTPLQPLESVPPYATPAAWASIYTGATPAEHSVLDFIDLAASDGRLVSGHSIRAAPIWKRLSDHGRRVAMIGFPLTYPPPTVTGVMVSGLPAPHRGALWSYPAEFDARLRAIPGFLPDPEMASPRVEREQSIVRLETHVQSVAQAALAAHEAYGRLGWDLFAVQFQALDAFQHMFWAWVDPEDKRFLSYPPSERQRARQFFRVLDDALRRLVETLQPSDILILSDHGFGPAYEAICPNHLLLDQGLLRLSVTRSRWHASLWMQSALKRLDVLNLRARLRFSARPGAAIDGLNRLTRDDLIDRQKSPAFVFSGGYCGLVNIKPGFESTVREALLQARHPTYNTPLFRSVTFPAELWDGPWLEAWGRCAIIQPQEGYLVDSHFRHYGLVAPVSAGLTGTHRPTGLLWTTLEALRPAQHVLHITPGILRALGLPFSQSQFGTDGAESSSPPLSSEDQAAVEERLRRLGYL